MEQYMRMVMIVVTAYMLIVVMTFYTVVVAQTLSMQEVVTTM